MIAIIINLQSDYGLGYLLVCSKVMQKKVQHKILKRIGQGVSTIYKNTNDSIAIMIDLQKVHLMDCLMGCLMVGSIVLHSKVHHKIQEQIEDKQLVICMKK